MRNDTTLINDVLEQIPNKYRAVITASRRARAINDGLAPSVRTGAAKPTTMALEEVAEGLVSERTPMLEEKTVDEEEQSPIPDDESQEDAEEGEKPVPTLDSESEDDEEEEQE